MAAADIMAEAASPQQKHGETVRVRLRARERKGEV